MRTVTSFPYEVRVDEHVWITVADGTRLAAKIWRPVVSDDEPVPAILEFIPYRKRDLTAPRDSIHHRYFAGYGYACARVDLRGSGDSEGVLRDEYLDEELSDAEQILAWLAEQPWCTGRTGMMGISWGGFNALQVATRRPPSLDAILTASSTDDRYADDVHYMGGCLLSDNLSWASTMFAYTTSPPDPALLGERWRELWLERMRGSGLWIEEWLAHQRRDSYWQHGSCCEDYSAIQCPVFAVSGWADGYSNAVFRLLAGLDVPRKGLIGPWSHKYPHLGVPGPAIGFLQEAVRWWDHWLKGRDTGVMDEPMLRVWMQDSVPPSTSYDERPGRWLAESAWPSTRICEKDFRLGKGRLLDPGSPAERDAVTVQSPLSVGQYGGKWCSYLAPPDLPYDQREDDGGSLVFDSDELSERFEILGAPVASLEFTVSAPVAMVAVRLSDIAPDGSVARVSYGLLNLTHRDGHAEPKPLRPGQRYHAEVALNGIAHSFLPGHRIRVAISTSYWPLAWPPPEPVLLTVLLEESIVRLPIRPEDPALDGLLRPFSEPEGAPAIATTQLEPGEEKWTVSRDLVTYASQMHVVKDLGTVHFEDIDLAVTRRADEWYSWTAEDFTSVRGEVLWHNEFRRADWNVRTETRTVLSCTRDDFYIHAELDAYEGAERILSRNWNTTIPRDCV
jgi:putative CocE/NonD family hydrolase